MRPLLPLAALLSSTLLASGCTVVVVDDNAPVWPETVEIIILEALVPQLHPDDGAGWDRDGTPPDLFAEFGIEGVDMCVTNVVADRYDPLFIDSACDFTLQGNDRLLFELWDDDFDEEGRDIAELGFQYATQSETELREIITFPGPQNLVIGDTVLTIEVFRY